MSTLQTIVITVGISLAVLAVIVLAFRFMGRKNETRIMSFSASDFRALGTANRNRMAIKDLNTMYRKVKYSAARAANNCKSRALVLLDKRIAGAYGEQFDKLFLNPFTERLTKEGFTVKYHPNGTMEMASVDKRHVNDPTFEISWKDAVEQDEPDVALGNLEIYDSEGL